MEEDRQRHVLYHLHVSDPCEAIQEVMRAYHGETDTLAVIIVVQSSSSESSI